MFVCLLCSLWAFRVFRVWGSCRIWVTGRGVTPGPVQTDWTPPPPSILSSPPVLLLRHPVAPEKAEQEKGGVALQQHISCKFMQNSEIAAAAAGSAAAAAVLHTARTRTAPAGCTGPTSPPDTVCSGRPAAGGGWETRTGDGKHGPRPPPSSSGERARQQQRLAGC